MTLFERLFLALLPFLFYGTLILTFVVQRLLTRVGARRIAADIRPELWPGAFVAGGYERVVDIAIARLAIRDVVKASKRGVLTLAGDGPLDGPVEHAVHAALTATRSRRALLRRLRHDPAILAVEKEARARGLMLHGSRLTWWYLVMVPFLVIASIALALAIYVIVIDRPKESEAQIVFIGGLIVAVLGFRLRVRHRPSPAGRVMVNKLFRTYKERVDAGVATMGYKAIHDEELRWALQKYAGIPRTGDGD